mgnify:CR=1 FL=1
MLLNYKFGGIMFKIIKAVFSTITNIFNALGLGFICLIFATIIVIVIDSTIWVIIWDKINQKTSVIHDLLFILSGCLLTFIVIFIMGCIIKSICKDWWNSIIVIKHALWDNFSGIIANFIARIINLFKNKKGFD